MKFYIPGTQRTDRVFRTNPFENTTRILYSMTANSTYASGTSLHTLSCVAVTNRQGTSTVSAETVTTYSKAAGATTVEATWAPSTYGVSCPRGQKMLARTVNSAAMSAATLYVAGHIF